MIFGPNPRRYIARRIAGPQTCPGPGDTLIDNFGNQYREVSQVEADMIRNSTGGIIYTIRQDGTIG